MMFSGSDRATAPSNLVVDLPLVICYLYLYILLLFENLLPRDGKIIRTQTNPDNSGRVKSVPEYKKIWVRNRF